MTDGTKSFNDDEYGDHNAEIKRYQWGDLCIDLTYPNIERNPPRITAIQINQESVRASDGIRVSYDYERDGFQVEQPMPIIKSVEDNCIDIGEQWIEVGFFQSWKFNNWEDGCPPDTEIKKFIEEQSKQATPSISSPE